MNYYLPPLTRIFRPSYGLVTSLWFILYRRDDKAKYTVLEAQNKRLGTLILPRYLARKGESIGLFFYDLILQLSPK